MTPTVLDDREGLEKDHRLFPHETFTEKVSLGHTADTTTTNLRYAAYTRSLRTLLLTTYRHVAPTTPMGASFHPATHPSLICNAYGISWAYLLMDVMNEGWRAYKREHPTHPYLDGKTVGYHPVSPLEDYRTVVAERALFHAVASVALPAVTVHGVVKYSGRALRDVANVAVRKWAPVWLGLSVVPFLPRMLDRPVGQAVERLFEWVFDRSGAGTDGKKL
ncbi:mitochondrial 18 KDa protein-domain-containing protein [Tricharina praecox]|uniref:mitochondrial 18 KDa protein-domain-containing protein n=1 Tax=Tricharina praecox TaxID=43433 RepID=UPI00221EBA9A|nr:mitochondrial 18 KDa protein-domain-containing protein [Tricharina praecox]KAI5840910.1 mitochondrial 18 KDa protein-domain-containing protein [Tricharina praecox]